MYLEDMNPYDSISILNDLNSNIADKDNTKIYFMSQNDFDFSPHTFSYFEERNMAKMINYNLDQLDWDIFLPILRPCITTTKGFDVFIKEIYKQKFPNLDGVLWLNDNMQTEINTIPVIGKRYYDNFGYIYNPAYAKKNFELEFTEVMKLTKQYFYVDNIYFKYLKIKLDDDHIYNMRKKFNFGLI